MNNYEFKWNDVDFLYQYSEKNCSEEEFLRHFNKTLELIFKDENSDVWEEEHYYELIKTINHKFDNDRANNLNQKIYELVLNETNPVCLEKIDEFLEGYDIQNFDCVNEYTETQFSDYKSENNIFNRDDLEEMADEDLKLNGMDSKYIFIVSELKNCDEELCKVNAYFNEIEDVEEEDVFEDFLEENWDDVEEGLKEDSISFEEREEVVKEQRENQEVELSR